MRKVNLIALALVAIYLLAAPLALGQGGNPPASTKESGATSGKGMTAVEQTGESGANVEQQIKSLTDQLLQAYLKGDTSFFEKCYADDAKIIHGDGKMTTKAQEIEGFKSGTLKYESIDMRELTIRAFGDTAVVYGLVSGKGMINGKPFSSDFRKTWVWAKQNGNWKLETYHITRIPASQ